MALTADHLCVCGGGGGGRGVIQVVTVAYWVAVVLLNVLMSADIRDKLIPMPKHGSSIALRPRKPESPSGRTGSGPGRPPRLSHSSWTKKPIEYYYVYIYSLPLPPPPEISATVPLTNNSALRKVSRFNQPWSVTISLLSFTTTCSLPGSQRKSVLVQLWNLLRKYCSLAFRKWLLC